MDSLPQWEALSEGARTQLLHSVVDLLHGDTQALIPHGDVMPWDELRRAGIVQSRSDSSHTIILTGAGTWLVLDALQAAGRLENLAV
ncbi:MAG: hypothetical protein H0X24_24110 [Ktedonobacterales bacterium]|nr:hypothetical protein [Ktedonobacterales bacterium]